MSLPLHLSRCYVSFLGPSDISVRSSCASLASAFFLDNPPSESALRKACDGGSVGAALGIMNAAVEAGSADILTPRVATACAGRGPLVSRLLSVRGVSVFDHPFVAINAAWAGDLALLAMCASASASASKDDVRVCASARDAVTFDFCVRLGYVVSDHLLRAIAARGDALLLRHVLFNFVFSELECIMAASAALKEGHVECVELLIARTNIMQPIQFIVQSTGGFNADVMRWAVSKGYGVGEDTFYSAAMTGDAQLVDLMWTAAEKRTEETVMEIYAGKIVAGAVEGGHRNIYDAYIRYLTFGSWYAPVMRSAISWKTDFYLQDLWRRGFRDTWGLAMTAVGKDDVDALVWLQTQGVPLDASLMRTAVEANATGVLAHIIGAAPHLVHGMLKHSRHAHVSDMLVEAGASMFEAQSLNGYAGVSVDRVKVLTAFCDDAYFAENPVDLALCLSNPPLLKWLLERGVPCGAMHLAHAVECGPDEALGAMIECSVNVDVSQLHLGTLENWSRALSEKFDETAAARYAADLDGYEQSRVDFENKRRRCARALEYLAAK